MNKNVSVIIRVRNEERWIGHAIQSVLNNIFKPEIIIINNNSSDNSLDIVRRFSEDPNLNDTSNPNYTNVKITNVENYSPGRSLNHGFNIAKYDNILVLSAHCVLKNFNLEKHLIDLEKFKAIFGNQIPIWDGKKITKRYIWSHFKDNEEINMFSDLEKRHFLHNALCLYKKNFVLDNKFDEELNTKEDRYWANNIVNNGLQYLYDPSLAAYHHYTENGATWKGLG